MRNSGTGDKKDLPKEFVAHDTRNSDKHPLRHAVMNVIRQVADFSTSDSADSNNNPATTNSQGQSNGVDPAVSQTGSNYLLTSLTLFTTHEPCVMCSMALLHSRVKEVIYLCPMPQTGACGSATCLPTLKGVNHKYSISRWKWDSGNTGTMIGSDSFPDFTTTDA
jgi:tRNA-specific adenosine deaminase 3